MAAAVPPGTTSQRVPRALRRELDGAEVELRGLLQAQPQDAALIVREPQRLILRIGAQDLFEPDSVSLRTQAQDSGGLGIAAQLLKRRRRLVAQIAVYTDDIGSPSANLSFSGERAAAILKALQSAKIAPNRLAAVGAGEAANLAGNDSPEERTQNRRVEISFGLSLAALPVPGSGGHGQ
jgi:outer membrane protein OmpA-like peptidoglycan-associated protein